jgi:hypothetical protein
LKHTFFFKKEHYHHALKFAREHPKFARMFEADSGSVFATSPVLAKEAGGKKGVVTDDDNKVKLGPQAPVLYSAFMLCFFEKKGAVHAATWHPDG